MKKIMNTGLALSFALLLSACGMPSSEELTGDVKEAQEKVKNVKCSSESQWERRRVV